MDPVTSVLLRKQSPHGFLQAHLAACAAGGNSSRGKSCQPQPSWLPWSLLCQSCHWSRCLPLAGCSPEVASDRPSGQSCLLSVSHSTGIFSQKHNEKGKAADHTISPITTKFATKKYSKCKCIHTSNLWLRADENKPQALSLPTERQAVKPLRNFHLLPHLLRLCPTAYEGWFFLQATKSGGARKNFRETLLCFPMRAGGGGSGLSESGVRALCHPPAATDGPWPGPSSPPSVPREGGHGFCWSTNLEP